MTATYDVFSWLLRHEDGRRWRIILIDGAVIHLATKESVTDVAATMDPLVARAQVEALKQTQLLEEEGYVLDSPVRVVQMPMILSNLVTDCQQRGAIGVRLAVVLKALQEAVAIDD